MTTPGIGVLDTTAIIAAIGDTSRFKRARDISAWLGLISREHMPGDTQTLQGISKRSNGHLRRLLIHGARSCKLHLDRSKDRFGQCIGALQSRMHVYKAPVALVAIIPRTVCIVLRQPEATYMRRPAEVVVWSTIRFCLNTIARLESDNEIVDRHSVNSARKRALCLKKLFGNMMRASRPAADPQISFSS